MMTQKNAQDIADILAGDMAVSFTNEEVRRVRGITLSMADLLNREVEDFDRSAFYATVGVF